ncbi:hypothetical protein ACKWTF_014368 [Chironomus riparius]
MVNSTSSSVLIDKIDVCQASSMPEASKSTFEVNVATKSSKKSRKSPKRTKRTSKRSKKSSKKFTKPSKIFKNHKKSNKKDFKIIKKLQQNQQSLQLELNNLLKERQVQHKKNMIKIANLRRQEITLTEQVVIHEQQYRDYQNLTRHMNSIIDMLSSRIQN